MSQSAGRLKSCYSQKCSKTDAEISKELVNITPSMSNKSQRMTVKRQSRDDKLNFHFFVSEIR